MNKKAFFFIDDVIWVFRDLARKQPSSMFDNPFLKALKEAHDRFGLKVQLNVFYRTDFYYGDDEFTLAEMPDIYKPEWEASSDWLRLAFHAKQEFPDYPYVNADYADVKANFDAIQKEIFRFAGEQTFAYNVVTHWLPMSREGCLALRDSGVKMISPSYGERQPYNGDPASLPYGHAARLLQNRKPETSLFTRVSLDDAITTSICGYNHISKEEAEPILMKLQAHLDKETGLYFKQFRNGPVLNLSQKETLAEEFEPLLGAEYIGYATHVQYFYSDYYAYQPDYAEKIFIAAELLHSNGYTHMVAEDFI